jgi:hypothetical protein
MRSAGAAAVLSALAVLLALLALVLAYAGRAVFRTAPFADRATAALQAPAVQQAVADGATTAFVNAGGGDLVAVRPLIRTLTGAAVQTGAFRALFRHAVAEAHTVVVQRAGGTAYVNVADAAVLVGGLLRRLAPAAARRLRVERVARLLTLRPSRTTLDTIGTTRSIAARAWLVALASVVLAAAALVLAPDRTRAVGRLGRGLAAGALALVALYLIGSAVAGHAAPAGRGPAARALWAAFLGGLQTQALLVAGAGAVVAAAAAARERSSIAPAVGRRARSAILLVCGVAIVLEPMAALRLAVLATGVAALAIGAAGVFAELRIGPTVRSGTSRAHGTARAGLGAWRAWLPGAVAAGVLAAAVAVIATGGGDEAPASAAPVTCNGYRALCARRLNDVAFPATHNSMASVTIPTWLFGQQDGTIADQLEHGIRGLLIDTYYAEPAGNHVRTDLRSLPKRAAAEREIGSEAVSAAESIRNRLGGGPTGSRAIYLCHTFCELGAVTLTSALEDLRSFLISNPGDVVVVVNQDEGVSPQDIEGAVRRAGLLDLVYRGALGPFPTLRQMVDSDQRLVVIAENDAGAIPWYHPAYDEAVQETPFRFTAAAELTDAKRLPETCRPERGPASAPLFLLNHWVDTSPVPRASIAGEVNARDVLLRRARLCQRIRHRLPNLIAVDFYRRGDVVGAARVLNGLSR